MGFVHAHLTINAFMHDRNWGGTDRGSGVQSAYEYIFYMHSSSLGINADNKENPTQSQENSLKAMIIYMNYLITGYLVWEFISNNGRANEHCSK